MAFTMKDYYANLKRGACPMCGGPRDADGFHCRRCLAGNRRRQALIPRWKKTNYQAAYRERNRRRGLCPECGQAPAPGRKYCSKCIQRRKGVVDGTPVYSN